MTPFEVAPARAVAGPTATAPAVWVGDSPSVTMTGSPAAVVVTDYLIGLPGSVTLVSQDDAVPKYGRMISHLGRGALYLGGTKWDFRNAIRQFCDEE